MTRNGRRIANLNEMQITDSKEGAPFSLAESRHMRAPTATVYCVNSEK